jgi:hypothetical protein
VPFWAALLAQGIVFGAGRLRTRRRLVAIGWAAGLLVYALPVLQALYFEPATWPFRWRDAAAFVERRVAPGDLLLYGDWPARETFNYYARRRYPSLELSSADAGAARTLTAQRARLLAARHPRVWLVVNGPVTPALRDRALPALGAAFRVADSRDFGGANLYLLTARTEPSR